MQAIGTEKLQFDENGSPYYLRTISKNGDTVKVLPENTKPSMVKELTVFVALKRSGYTPDMRSKTWYGLQELSIKIPNERQYRNHFLCYDKKSMGTICVKVVNPSLKDSFGNFNTITYNFELSPNRDSREFSWVKRIGKAKQITPLKVTQLLQDKEIIAVLSDSGLQAF